MDRLESHIKPQSDSYIANKEAMLTLIATLEKTLSEVELGGGERARERHHGHGKLLPRDRLTALLDPGSPFWKLHHWLRITFMMSLLLPLV